jgi:hypothetical protein
MKQAIAIGVSALAAALAYLALCWAMEHWG